MKRHIYPENSIQRTLCGRHRSKLKGAPAPLTIEESRDPELRSLQEELCGRCIQVRDSLPAQ